MIGSGGPGVPAVVALVPRILVVDDEPDILESLRDLLECSFADAHVQTATCGEDAIALVEAERPDALVTDFRMPGMDGLELLGHLPQGPRMAVLMVTAYTQASLELAAARAGVCAILPKPIVVADFLQAVSSCLADTSA